jgi:predicted amidophosphoribosyltransferase
MKRCKDCRVTYPDSYIYCPKCGAKLKNDPLPMGDLFTKEDDDFFKL